MKNHKKLRNALATLLLALPLALQGAVGVKTAQAAETNGNGNRYVAQIRI